MRIDNIKLTNFRNHTETKLKLGDITILKGPNGAGKTNILESVYMMSVCRSYRSRKDSEVLRWGEEVARISIDTVADSGEGTNMALAQSGDKKTAFIKESQVPISLIVGKLPSIIFAPEIMQLPYDSPGRRRRYLDIFLSELEPKYLSTLVKYHKVVKARNRLLERAYLKKFDAKEMEFWDEELSKLGKMILTARQKAVKEINSKLSDNLKKINGSNRKLVLQYHSTVDDIDKYGEELAAHSERDIRERCTTAGPHRDDWRLVINGNEVRDVSSRGEVRTIVLALKMAEMEILRRERGEVPVLLLDDVFAELDKKHSEALLDLIDGAQTIITATDAEYIPESIKDKATIIDIKAPK